MDELIIIQIDTKWNRDATPPVRGGVEFLMTYRDRPNRRARS
jgi:hypothetical protein